jgi:hypothetical protein
LQEPRDFSFSQYKQRKSSHYHYIPPPKVQFKQEQDSTFSEISSMHVLICLTAELFCTVDVLTHFVLFLSRSVSTSVISDTVLFSIEFYSTPCGIVQLKS